jgi:Ricin-type beta-trefoil lectin domain
MFRRIPRIRVGAIACAAALARLPRRAATLVLAGVLPLSAALLAGSAAPASAAVAFLPPSPVQMENIYTKTCLDGGEWAFHLGNIVLLDPCVGGYQPENWEIAPHNGYFNIVPAAGGACLDGVEGTNGVTLKPCVAGDLHQQWVETKANGSILNTFEDQANNECLDGTADYGVRVMPCSFNNDTHQEWGA